MRQIKHPVKYIVWFCLICLTSGAFPQTKRDARCLALGGAYTVISRGYHAVGYNPANLALSHDYSFYLGLGGVNFSFSNNLVSLERYNRYNGKDLEANDAMLKNEFLNSIPEVGWRIFSDLDFSFPGLNYSSGNMALTSDLMFIVDIGIPKSLMQILFDENEINKTFDMSLMEDLLVVGEYGYSIALPTEKAIFGFTAKYLQGIAYIGLNPDSSTGSFLTSGTVSANGQYLMEQAVGGMGVAFDVGLTLPGKDENSWTIGVSLINLFGRIFWKNDTFSSTVLFKKNNLPFNGQYYRYTYSINDINGYNLWAKSNDSDQLIESHIQTYEDSSSLKTDYPTLFRIGVGKYLNSEVLFVSDLVAGFTDRFFAFGRWQFSSGLEFTRFPAVPVRVGLSIGGKNMQMITMGSGIHKGILHFDWALGFRQGIWLHTARGLYFSMDLYLTGKSRKKSS